MKRPHPDRGHRHIALAGNPNCGKSTLFNALTGLRQKVGNYPGVTVERKAGHFHGLHGEPMVLIDLPGAYSLQGRSPDEAVLRDVLLGCIPGMPRLDAVVAVVDASNLERSLYLVAQLLEMETPLIVALNMADVAEKAGIHVDRAALEEALGVPVIPVVATQGKGITEIKIALSKPLAPGVKFTKETTEARYAWIDALCARVMSGEGGGKYAVTDALDRTLTHPVWGWAVFLGMMCLLFVSLFTLAQAPMAWIESGVAALAHWFHSALPESQFRDLLANGVIPGVGGVLLFLPQILILYFFLSLLEESGYMARAAFLMDRVMATVGLHGKSFIPLLSSFACAIPGVMAARTIENRNDRLTTILIAPLMSCSARLPVYTLMISILLPSASAWGKAGVMVALYFLGIAAAFALAWIFKRTIFKGAPSMLLLEMPPYRLPSLRSAGLAMKERAMLFVTRAGTVILTFSILLWALFAYPKPGEPLEYSYAGRIGRFIEPAIQPLGYDWKIGVGLLSSVAAREVFVSTMAIVYSGEEETPVPLRDQMAAQKRPDGRPLYTPLVCVGIMVFYVLAMQCIGTLAVVWRETGSWRWPLLQLTLFGALAWTAALLVYQGGRLLGFQ